MKYLLSIALVTALLMSGCTMPTSYYTNPQSAGYNQQKLGAICPFCNQQVLISGNQLHNRTEVTCPYCSKSFNTKAAAKNWVLRKQKNQQHQTQEILTGAISGIAQGLEQHNAEQRQRQIIREEVNRANTLNQPSYKTDPYPKSWNVRGPNGTMSYCTQYYEGGVVQCN